MRIASLLLKQFNASAQRHLYPWRKGHGQHLQGRLPVYWRVGAVRPLRQVMGVVLTLLIVGCSTSTEERYLDALDREGVRSEFIADRQAIENAKRVCAAIDAGGEAQGTKADRIGVTFYCNSYKSAFKILQTLDIEGSFIIVDENAYQYSSDGSTCRGEGGYSDYNSSTQVQIRDSGGKLLSSTTLGEGSIFLGGSCAFDFIVPDVAEGADGDIYVATIGRVSRGEFTFTFRQLSRDGLHLTIGS